MSQTETSMEPATPWEEPDTALRAQEGPDRLVEVAGSANSRSIWLFLRHLVEMVVAMMIGMGLGVWIFTAIVGVSYKQTLREYPTAALIVMAVSMAIPMVAWMRIRRHSWRNSMEMGAAMLLPAIPFLVCLWAHVFDKAPNGPYMTASSIAMLALMIYRWDVYAAHPMKPLAARSGSAGHG